MSLLSDWLRKIFSKKRPTPKPDVVYHAVGVTVFDRQGTPVDGAEVRLATFLMKTNADGYVCFTHVPVTVKNATIQVSAEGYHSLSEVVPLTHPGEMTVRIGEPARENTDVVLTGLHRLTPFTRNALIGQLRKVGRSYGDVSGPRTVFFCSWFPALRIWRDDRARAIAELDRIAEAGWQGIRVFAAVGGWSPYWDGREVAPVDIKKQPTGATYPAWPDYDEQLRTFLEAVRVRGLKLHITTGDMQCMATGTAEVALHERIARIVNEVDPTVIGLWECWNEGWQNQALGETPEGLEQARRIIAAVKRILPDVLCATTAPSGNEEAEPMLTWSKPGDVVAIHGTRFGDRDPSAQARRAFGLAYWDGEMGQRKTGNRPFWQGEPSGPNVPGKTEVSVAETSIPRNIWLLYTTIVAMGQGLVYFNGPAIRYRDGDRLDETWGFREMPELLSKLPKDVGQYPSILHGNRPDAPITAEGFWWHDSQSPQGPERVDMVFAADRIVCIVHGGRGTYRIKSRRAMEYEVYGEGGLVTTGRVNAGEVLPGEWSVSAGPRLIVVRFV